MSAPLGPLLRRQSFPLSAALFMYAGSGVVDAYCVGLAGLPALAALGYALPVTTLAGQIAVAYSVSTTSGLARRLGRRDPSAVADYGFQNLLLGLVGALATSAALVAGPLAAAELGADSETARAAGRYVMIWSCGFPFVYSAHWCFAALRATGDPWPMVLGMVLQALVIAALDPLLILGLGPIPAFGLEGAAATNAISCIVMLAYVAPKVGRSKVRLLAWGRRRGFSRVAGETCRIVLPVAAAYASGPVMSAVYTGMLSGYSAAAVAIYAAFCRLEMLFAMGPRGIAAGSAALIAQSWGANDHARIRLAARWVLKVCVAWGVLGTALVAAASEDLSRAFLDRASSSETVWALRALALSLLPYSVLVAISALDNNTSAPYRTFVLSSLRTVGLGLALAYWGERWFGFVGLVGAVPAASALTACVGLAWQRFSLASSCGPAWHP